MHVLKYLSGGLVVCATLATSIATAETSSDGYPFLPLPDSITPSHYGYVYAMPDGYPAQSSVAQAVAAREMAKQTGAKEPQYKTVLYAGTSPNSNSHFLLDINNPSEKALTFEASVQKCESVGQGWDLPTIEEMKVLTKFIHKSEEDFLPALYWTQTEAECHDEYCMQDAKLLKLYNPKSGNERMMHNLPFIKHQSTCVYRF